MLDIYTYTEAHSFMKDAWLEKKKRNANFSITAWSKKLGFENSSPLSLTLKGKRSLPKKYIPRVIETLELDPKEALYFEALVELSRSKTDEQKEYYLEQMQRLSPTGHRIVTSVDEYNTLSDPLSTAILEMSGLKGFRSQAKWIHERVRLNVTLENVEFALNRLERLGLIKKNAQGEIEKTHQNLKTEDDLSDLATKHFHQRISHFASKQVYEQSVEEREYQSYAFNMKRKDMERAKDRIRKFLDDFFTEFEAPENEGDETFQFNVQLFKLTK